VKGSPWQFGAKMQLVDHAKIFRKKAAVTILVMVLVVVLLLFALACLLAI
jgi:hypothetical protein